MHPFKLTFVLFALFAATSSAVHTVAELELVQSTSSAVLQLHTDVLQGDAFRDTLCHVITVCGKRGAQKSTLLRSLGTYFNMSDADFESKKWGVATTTSVDISDVSDDNNLLIDTIGNDDPAFARRYGLKPAAVDRAMTQLVAPVANVLIYTFKDAFGVGDLDTLELYADHSKYHLGEMQKLKGRKPTLILAVRTNDALMCNVDMLPQECDPEEYLRQSLPSDHPARFSFRRIELLRIPELEKGGDWELIQQANFFPRKVKHYWEAIEKVGQIINEVKGEDVSAYWTGGQLGNLFEHILLMINDDIVADLPSVRTAQLIISAQSEARKLADSLMNSVMQPYVDEPFHDGRDKSSEKQLAESRAEAELAILKKFEGHREERNLYESISKAVAEELNKKEKEISAKVEARTLAIMRHMQSAFESCRNQMTAAEETLAATLTGDPREVDTTLVMVLRAAVQQHHTALKGWTLLKSAADDNLSMLKMIAQKVWTAGHEINEAKHGMAQNILRAQAQAPVEFDYMNGHVTTAHEHTHVHKDMGKVFPSFFSDEALRNTVSIDARFEATLPCSGLLTLKGDDKDYTICESSHTGKKGHRNVLYYNPVSKVLHAWTYGWGYGGGRKTNFNKMSGVSFTVVANGLADAPEHLAKSYEKGTTPEF